MSERLLLDIQDFRSYHAIHKIGMRGMTLVTYQIIHSALNYVKY